MTTHVAAYFRKRRLSLGLKLSEVALRMGCPATDRSLSHGCNRLYRFEQTGEISAELFQKLTAALEIDQTTVNGLLKKDLEDWTKWANEPVRPYLSSG